MVTQAWSVTLAETTWSNAALPPVGVRWNVAISVLVGWPVTRRADTVT